MIEINESLPIPVPSRNLRKNTFSEGQLLKIYTEACWRRQAGQKNDKQPVIQQEDAHAVASVIDVISEIDSS
jgi:hypothetical protein